jgi:hypothetical protein
MVLSSSTIEETGYAGNHGASFIEPNIKLVDESLGSKG